MAVPNPPRDEHGALASNRYHVLASVRPGILGSCCACGHTCGTWWHDGTGAYTALHERCAPKLVEMWQAMIEDGIGETPAVGRLTGAYARRAAARAGGRTGTDRTAPPISVRSVDRGSPFFRPGMPDGSPWVAFGQSITGQPLVPCGSQQAARDAVTRWRSYSERDITPPGMTTVVGGVVVGPDGALSESWGRYPTPGEPEPWLSLIQSRDWFTCGQCGQRRHSGCWRALDRVCMPCVREGEQDGRPAWPVDPAVFSADPLTVKPTKAREKSTTIA